MAASKKVVAVTNGAVTTAIIGHCQYNPSRELPRTHVLTHEATIQIGAK
eukprot:CAMPEP_0184495200 /NCGR_PEP_ID=MMETSP0113_2-20130426/30631_1 /TAXON_ID=91329 /ORGANISM="Norrisiella sphaerica, Strain BC52" /LENGTH=48 /DNA_ID= /DNA_START= /DNA_END= /DNA_ORIENTATION=